MLLSEKTERRLAYFIHALKACEYENSSGQTFSALYEHAAF